MRENDSYRSHRTRKRTRARFLPGLSPLNRAPRDFGDYYTDESQTAEKSIDNTLEALCLLPEVQLITKVELLTPKYLRGINLEAVIDPRAQQAALGVVDVRVASSETGIRALKDKIGEQYQFDASEVDIHLAQLRLAIINGQAPETRIQRDFLYQLEFMSEIARRNS
jgi:hypothetical protein